MPESNRLGTVFVVGLSFHFPTSYKLDLWGSEQERAQGSIRSAGSEIVPGLVRFPNFGNQNRCKNDFYSEEYRVRQHNSLLEIEKRAALGRTSQCSPVLPSNPFPVGHSLAEPGIHSISRFHLGQNESILNSFELGLTQP